MHPLRDYTLRAVLVELEAHLITDRTRDFLGLEDGQDALVVADDVGHELREFVGSGVELTGGEVGVAVVLFELLVDVIDQLTGSQRSCFRAYLPSEKDCSTACER